MSFQLPKSSLGMKTPFAGVSRTEVSSQQMILEDAGAADPQAVATLANQQSRSDGMAVILAWSEDADSSYDSIDAYAAGVADIDDSGDVDSDDEITAYNDCLSAAFDALISLGADADTASSFINDEDDAAGAKLQAFIKEAVGASSKSYDEIIAGYAVSGDIILESGMKKVVRGGKATFVHKKKGRRKKFRNSLQKQSIKKARRFSHKAAANVHRAKSNKVRAHGSFKVEHMA